MRYTPRFPKKTWELMKIQDFLLSSIAFYGKSTNNHGYSCFPNVSWEIWVCISSTPKSCAGLLFGALPVGLQIPVELLVQIT